jgi:hypothetical protein
MLLCPRLELLRSVECRYDPQQFTVETKDKRTVSSAQPDGTFGHCLKDGLKIER